MFRESIPAVSVLVGISAMGLGGYAQIVQEQERSKAEVSQIETRLDEAMLATEANAEGLLQAKTMALDIAQQVRNLGKEPIADPESLPDPVTVGDTVKPAVTGVTRSEVQSIALRLIRADPKLTEAKVSKMIAEAVSNLPDPPPGAKGDTGLPGEPGDPGSTGEKGDKGDPGSSPSEAEIRVLVNEVYAANPPPAGQQGDKGDPGVGIQGLVITQDGELVVTLTDGSVLNAGSLPIEDGDPFCPPGTTQQTFEGHFYDAPNGRARILVCVA